MALMPAARDDYLAHLLALRPPGPAWPADDPHLGAAAEECTRAHNRAVQLVEEADPRTTYEQLADWERVAGLPDPCTPAAASVGARRLSLVQRLTMQGGASRAYFVALAAALGYPGAAVTEFVPMTCVSACADALNPPPAWLHAWQLNLGATRVMEMNCLAPCDDSLRGWGDATVECVVRRLKPAHTEVLFTYGD